MLLWMWAYALLGDTGLNDSSITEYLRELQSFQLLVGFYADGVKLVSKRSMGNFQLKCLHATCEAARKV